MRTILIALLTSLPVFAAPNTGTIVAHLQLSDSVRQQLASGAITVKITASSNLAVTTTSDTARFDDVPPGHYSLRAFITAPREMYVVNPNDVVNVDVKPGAVTEATMAIPSLIVSGHVTYRGEPVRGQMQLWASSHTRDDWGFTVPFDEQCGFFFPLPHAGDWDVDVIWDHGKASTPLSHFAINGPRDIALPEGSIAGAVVDEQGNAVPGAHVRAVQGRAMAYTTANADGLFTIEGLPAGKWNVETHSGRQATSQPVAVELAENGVKEHVVVRVGGK
jgi:Carboxypeptidase regulatory-like domain